MKFFNKFSITLIGAVAIVATAQLTPVVAISTQISSVSVVAGTKAEDFFMQGNDKYKKGDYQGAVEAYTQAIVLNPKYLFCDEPNSGLDPVTSMIIDKLIKELTIEYNITTIINTHDMNSVMEIGDNILYMVEGKKEWTGNSKDIIFSDNKQLNEFIFASEFLQDAKSMRMMEANEKKKTVLPNKV
mgnify:CR=1 FL=1